MRDKNMLAEATAEISVMPRILKAIEKEALTKALQESGEIEEESVEECERYLRRANLALALAYLSLRARLMQERDEERQERENERCDKKNVVEMLLTLALGFALGFAFFQIFKL